MHTRTLRRSALLVFLVTACGGTIVPAPDEEQNGDGDGDGDRRGDTVRPVPIGDGDDVGYGGGAVGIGGSIVVVGDGDGDLYYPGPAGGSIGMGGSDGGPRRNPLADFVVGGFGVSEGGDTEWSGYLFTTVSADSFISPDYFGSSEVCAAGRLGPNYEEWAAVGWYIAQPLDPLTYAGLEPEAIAPGGEGVSVSVENFEGRTLRVVLRENDSDERGWCALIPASGSGVILWSEFRKECWAPGGEVYDPATPISEIMVQAVAGSETVQTRFDFCVIHLGPAVK